MQMMPGLLQPLSSPSASYISTVHVSAPYATTGTLSRSRRQHAGLETISSHLATSVAQSSCSSFAAVAISATLCAAAGGSSRRQVGRRKQIALQADNSEGPSSLLGRRQLLSAASTTWITLPAAASASSALTAPEVVKSLWGPGLSEGEDVERWVAAFAADGIYEDLYYAEPAKGHAALRELIRQKELPKGSRLVLDHVSDGKQSCGFTWHVEQQGVGTGQRGLAFVRLDPQTGKVSYVREVGEPLFKAGELTEQLLTALTKDQAPPQRKPASGPPQNPKTAKEVVKYLYGDVQQSGGDAVRFYADNVVYEDMNYEKPFIGKAAVEGFLKRFEAIQGVTFVLEEVSDGDVAVGFTYRIEIAGQPRGIRGATYYEVDGNGKVIYVRDVPESATKPPPVQLAARFLQPGLRRLAPAEALPGDIGR
eukprot:TRINITY_DN112499_c0_g1_i1.p1 TRINITY_DN112499_c0_g1~~TRINITY_DN112499_c0_g1_i1.p1  ORF type:complete len:423 (-),score=94.30 TRINITY_DN112499_c0_g1_i1:390-1658(-)